MLFPFIFTWTVISLEFIQTKPEAWSNDMEVTNYPKNPSLVVDVSNCWQVCGPIWSSCILLSSPKLPSPTYATSQGERTRHIEKLSVNWQPKPRELKHSSNFLQHVNKKKLMKEIHQELINLHPNNRTSPGNRGLGCHTLRKRPKSPNSNEFQLRKNLRTFNDITSTSIKRWMKRQNADYFKSNS